MGGATMKVVKAIEENGATVVAFENCTGAKAIEENVDETNPDVYDAIARKYMNIGCSCMSPNDNRIKLLDQMIDDYQVDGVIDMVLQACHTYSVETLRVKRFVNEEKHIPYMNIETDYSQADIGQLNTRIAAFIEML
jgi:benzoyl-CoA reductase/2-hydroxyglutaryl-CoA dehydratase subunit BcrC/BadD/HgdB